MAQALADGDALLGAHLARSFDRATPAVALNTAFMRDGAVIRRCDGCQGGAADHPGVRCAGRKPAAVFTRSLVVVGRAREATLIEIHGSRRLRIRSTPRSRSSVGDDAQVEHVKITAERQAICISRRLLASVGANARFNYVRLHHRARVVRNQLFVRFEGEGTEAGLARRQPAAAASSMSTPRWSSITRAAAARAARCSSRCSTARAARRLPGQDHRAAGRAEDRRQDDQHALLLSEEAEADNKPELEIFADDVVCGHGATAGALDERLAVLPARARHSENGSRGAADPGFRRRGDRGDRARRPARGADGARRRLARGARGDAMHPAGQTTALRRRAHPRGFPDPGDAGLRQAAGLSRQRRLGAEAEGGARPHRAGLHDRIRQRASRPALSRQRRDRGLRGRAREGARVPQRRARPKRSSSPATPPRRSTSSRYTFGARADQGRATRSCSRSWSTIPTSCRGISCASARAR